MAENVLILNSGKCSWGKCFFCGYGKIYGCEPTEENIKNQIDRFFKTINSGTVKVFGSGSFLDEKQMPAEMRRYFAKKCLENNVGELTIESRPEFIREKRLDDFGGIKLTVAIGLETSNSRLLKKINKGFTTDEYEKAAKILHGKRCSLRTYLLANLPFVKNAGESLDESVNYALKFSDSVVIINLLPHYDSGLFELWTRGEWNFMGREGFYALTKKWKGSKKIELDVETFRFVPKFPRRLRENLAGVGEKYLVHPHFEVWQDYLARWYRPPAEKPILLFLPCSSRKPYSESKTHELIIQRLRKRGDYARIHQVMISNAGVVPREFENMYPFDSYDWDERLETKEIRERYVEVTSDRIKRYLTAHKNNYTGVFCFLKYDSESYKALKKACEESDINMKNVLGEKDYGKVKSENRPLQTELALGGLGEW